jgi:glycine/D-amino acid oxidase-like deaminating enzyme
MDYGADDFYTDWMAEALEGWQRWNAGWARPLYHPDGMLVLGRDLDRGGFEGDSWALLRARGLNLTRTRAGGAHASQWRGFPDGYFNPRAGWAESGEVLATLVRRGLALGITQVAASATQLLGEERVRGVVTDVGPIAADRVVVAAGTWTQALLPDLADRLRSVGQPVLHVAPSEPQMWRPPHFHPWAADIGNTGWYGFPATASGVVKVANHGPGVSLQADDAREVDEACVLRFREFFRAHLPGLADAPVVGRHLCLYSDSFDGHFLVDGHPDRAGLVVASGGSGHAFKFAPCLGPLIADVVEGAAPPHRFRWRELGQRHTEAARYDG